MKDLVSRNILKIALCLTLMVVVLTPLVLFAQAGGGSDPSLGITNPLGDNFQSLGDFIRAIVTQARNIGMLVAVLGIVYAGFLKVTARGDEEKLKKANKAFLWSVLGTAVLLGAWLIAITIQNTVRDLEGPSSMWHSIEEPWIG